MFTGSTTNILSEKAKALPEAPLFMIEPKSFSQTWSSIDDVVMGGNSMSVISCKKDKSSRDFFIEFKGDVSLRDGGFTIARTRNANPPLDVSSFRGILI